MVTHTKMWDKCQTAGPGGLAGLGGHQFINLGKLPNQDYCLLSVLQGFPNMSLSLCPLFLFCFSYTNFLCRFFSGTDPQFSVSVNYLFSLSAS